MPLLPYNGVLGKKHAAHLLRRATFGGTKAEIDGFSNLTPSQAIEQLFQESVLPEPPIDPAIGGTWALTPPADNDTMDNTLQNYFRRWWFGQLCGTGVPDNQKLAFKTRERIVFLFHTHFTTIQETVGNSRALYFQNILFRMFALDDTNNPLLTFKELSKKICIDNAMIILLDGRLNVRGRPNENFARELLELYTIGKGLPGQIPETTVPGDYYYFTEQDVQAAARVVSGYDLDRTFTNLDPDTDIPRAIPKLNNQNIANQHDNDPKVFSHRLGNAVITPNADLLNGGRATEESMLDELDQLIELLFTIPETHKNICRRIYRFYVYHAITTEIESTIIAEMVNTFVANNFRIEPVIKELLSSRHFYDSMNATVDDDNIGALIKSPLDLTIGTLNFFKYCLPDPQGSPAEFYTLTGALIGKMNRQGMNFVNPFDVAGYDAYHQFPLYNRNWISANTLTQRYKFIFDVMSIENMEENPVSIDLLAFIKEDFAAYAQDPDVLVRELASYLLPMSEEGTEILPERLNYFTSRFLELGTGLPQGSLAFWQFSWNHTESIPASRDDARGMLQDLTNAMLQSPEYQLF
ncbi:MAG: DUF1800 family protein [Cytophagaceae bacterium]